MEADYLLRCSLVVGTRLWQRNILQVSTMLFLRGPIGNLPKVLIMQA